MFTKQGGKMGRMGDGKIGRWEDWEMGRLGDGKIGRWEDWEMGRLGDWKYETTLFQKVCKFFRSGFNS
jgi:hypothetical protein